ncbi:beta-ketoacyl synthase N-terminal-like domain-containing protein [Anaerocolumna sp. AGMB13025]|uniref:beta-ketoacyl synthase N-terminal-like domain-containing protein n=1 Tax=Anaerocolumna sp. AGMB13025 TaxID=3039116 RepID=UPI00241E525F|nr:beta-ketoacyl synthase N-terminal-like domain-containing protein [Anaerocolumna sp. AGMB13025]WFR55600.1 beta-ketoacyl synthase N-terminal-like domain-containing protein [Anaerocolumna sp. AGMB13025]
MIPVEKVTLNQSNKDRIYVTGMGVINAIADSIPEFEHSLRNGLQRFRYLEEKKINNLNAIGADISYFSLENKLKKKELIFKHPDLNLCQGTQMGVRMDYYPDSAQVPGDLIDKAIKTARRAPLTIKAAVSCVLEAYLLAELFKNPIPKDRIAVIVTGSNLTNTVREGYSNKFEHDPEYLTPQYALQFMDTDHVGTLSEIFGIGGEGFTVGGASASGNAGIIKAHQLIKLGLADACVVVGALTELTNMELQGFYNIGALGGRKYYGAPDKTCRPFDEGHEGFVYGQASGCLILESRESTEKRRIKPLAEMFGGVINLDGNRSSNPSLDGEVKAMAKTLEAAGVKPEEVDYINAHGSSSPLGDETELKAIKEVYKENISKIWINSTKGLTGHCLFSAGVVEAIAVIIQMNSGFIHPNANLENPIDCEFLFAGKTAVPAAIKLAMSNSFGFGGINTSILIKNIKGEIKSKK